MPHKHQKPQRSRKSSRNVVDDDYEEVAPSSSSGLSPTPSQESASTYMTHETEANLRGVSLGADSGLGATSRSSKSRSEATLDQIKQVDSCMSLAGKDGYYGDSISLNHQEGTVVCNPGGGSVVKDQHPSVFDRAHHISYGAGGHFNAERATRTRFDSSLELENNFRRPPSYTSATHTGADVATMAASCDKAGKFRYVVAFLIVVGVTLNAYASNTMYIAAIEMISNDVIQSGLTNLRASHLSKDPLAEETNAALPGTCPVETADPHPMQHSARAHQLVKAYIEEKLQVKLPNASEISAHERLAMAQDTEALYEDVNERLASGQLVDWSIQQRGYVFTAHNIGSILMAVPISWLGLTFGSWLMTFICIFLSAVRMAVLPTIAGHAPFWATFVFELTVGSTGPNIVVLGYPLAAAWLLPHEANLFVAMAALATLVGTAATNFASTQLLASGLDWCWCYYIPAILLGLLSICWYIWGADRPEKSRFVKKAELKLLQGNTIAMRNESLLKEKLGGNNASAAAGERKRGAYGDNDDDDEKTPLTGKTRANRIKCHCATPEQRAECPASNLKRKPNWLVIALCPTIWALILVSFANHYTTKNATLWPTFFSNILHIDSSTIGIMLGFKGVWALLFCTIFAILTRKLIVNRPFNLSLTAYRRWNYAIATAFYSASVVLMVLMDCNKPANLVSLLIQPLVASFNSLSADQMPLDLSAEDSGLVVSVVRTVAIGDIVALPVSSFILAHAQDALAGDRRTWQIVWSVGLAVRLVTALYFVLVAKSQPKSYSRLEPSGPCKSS